MQRKNIKKSGGSKAVRFRKNKPLILLFSILFALVVIIGGTVAWFTAADSRTNNLISNQRGEFSVTAVDVFDPAQDHPDDLWNKRVGAVNTAEKPGFVRLLVLPTFVLPAETPGAEPTVLPAEFGTHVLIEDLNTTDWALGEDGYYYYLHILQPGESTDAMTPAQNLFNKVKVNMDAIHAEYHGAELKIEVKCEAVGIQKWDYRTGWWGTTAAPTQTKLQAIDTALAALAK